MELLLTTADEMKMAPGTLCRKIVWEKLQDMQSSKTPGSKSISLVDINKRLESIERQLRKR